uniref:Uncharacterized protein n=1 Tax=Panagrellus redivivus TaxID=6233 RepID=A0A7E4ZQ82_PANRE
MIYILAGPRHTSYSTDLVDGSPLNRSIRELHVIARSDWHTAGHALPYSSVPCTRELSILPRRSGMLIVSSPVQALSSTPVIKQIIYPFLKLNQNKLPGLKETIIPAFAAIAATFFTHSNTNSLLFACPK